MQLIPLVVSRDKDEFLRWWSGLPGPDRARIDELLEPLWDPFKTEAQVVSSAEFGDSLTDLFTAIFQDFGGGRWLRVSGLAPAAVPRYMTLDIDPAFDGCGQRDGVDVVFQLHLQPSIYLIVAASIDRPERVFPLNTNDLHTILVRAIDTALDVINKRIAVMDEFTTAARQVAPEVQAAESDVGTVALMATEDAVASPDNGPLW